MSNEAQKSRYGLRAKAASICLSAALLATTFTGLGGTFGASTEADAASSSSESYDYGLMDNIQKGTILHCFNWTYNDIKTELPNIAEAGFTSVQTSPAQKGVGESKTWYWLYQPVAFRIETNRLGTEEELKSLCDEAHKYGIKVIVDVVANHLAENHQQEEFKSINSEYWHDHTYSTAKKNVDWTNRNQVTHCDIGMPDLATENSDVQQVVTKYVNNLKEVGVDGIRWDAVKHIGLPSEGDDFFAKVLANNGLYNYGEILGGSDDRTSGNESLMKEYSDYMSVTDSDYGAGVLSAFNNNSAPTTTGNWAYRGVSSSKLVYWGESHDTYSNTSSEGGWTKNISQNKIDRAYAVVASRANATSLYFSRPVSTTGEEVKDKEDIKSGVKGSTHFTSAEVAAVNHFHNAMGEKLDYYQSSNGCAVITRQGGGAVIVQGSGSGGTVSVVNGGGYAAPGTYKDEITGNTFTVTSTTISGTVGSSGIAVIYRSELDNSKVSASVSSGTLFTDNLTLELNASGVTNARYETSEGASGSYTDGQTITVGDITEEGSTVTVTLSGTKSNGNTTKAVYTYTKKDTKDVFIYFDNSNYNWSKVCAYIYDKSSGTAKEMNGSWPGKALIEKTSDGLYVLKISDDFKENGRVIFSNNGSSNDRYPADKQPGLEIDNSSKKFSYGNKWEDYSSVTGSVSAVPATGTSFKDETLEVTLYATDVANPTYTTSESEGASTSYTNGQTITIGSGTAYGNDITVTLSGTRSDGSITTATYIYTKKDPQSTVKLYFDKTNYSSWNTVCAYIYDGSNENEPWKQAPAMTNISGSYYEIEVPDDLVNGKVIFVDTKNTDNRYPGKNTEGLDIGGSSKKFLNNSLLELPFTLSLNVSDLLSFGNSVTLTAETENTFGDVKYTFSVGSSTIESNGSTAVWTPSAAGTYEITVTATDTTGTTVTTSKTVTVSPAKISSATVSITSNSYTYDGNPKTQTVTVKFKGQTLTEGTDYTVTGNSGTNVDKYTITVTGKGNYTDTVSMNWEIVDTKYTVAVKGGTFADGTTADKQVNVKTSITVIASSAESGKKFSHWEIDNQKVSTSERYSFIVLKDTTVTAVYVQNAAEVKQEPILNLSVNQTTYNNKKALGFVFNRSVPSGYTVKSTGLIYGTNKLLGYTSDNTVDLTNLSNFGVADILKTNKTNKVKTYEASSKANNGTVTFNYAVGANVDAYVYAMAYVTVNDESGKETTYYSDVLAITYNTIS